MFCFVPLLSIQTVTAPSAQLFGSAFSGHPFTAHPQKEANTIQLAAVFTQLPTLISSANTERRRVKTRLMVQNANTLCVRKKRHSFEHLL